MEALREAIKGTDATVLRTRMGELSGLLSQIGAAAYAGNTGGYDNGGEEGPAPAEAEAPMPEDTVEAEFHEVDD